MDFSFILFFFPWLASNLGNTWTQKPHQPPKKPVLKLQVNFSRLHEAAMALTKGGWSFRAAMVAQVDMLLNCSCTQRRKSARRLCEMLLPKICLNRFSSSVGNYQIKWFKTENWKNSSSRGKKVSLGAWCPLPRNLWSISSDVGTVIWLYYKTDWKNAQIGVTSTSSQRWLQKPQLTARVLSNHIQGVVFVKGIKDQTKLLFSSSSFKMNSESLRMPPRKISILSLLL